MNNIKEFNSQMEASRQVKEAKIRDRKSVV